MRENASQATPVLRQRHPNVLPFEGDIDLHISPVVTETLNAMIKKKPEWIMIDLSGVTYIDSAGMAALILAMQEVEAYGGRFFLSGLQEPYARFSKFRGLMEYFGFFQMSIPRWPRANHRQFSPDLESPEKAVRHLDTSRSSVHIPREVNGPTASVRSLFVSQQSRMELGLRLSFGFRRANNLDC